MKYILALDQGTTSSRSILFNEKGRPIAVAQKEFRQIFPRPGWVEHDPVEIWESQKWTMQEVVRKGQIDHRNIAAIGITNQRETAVAWNRSNGQPVGNAIVWQDRRTADMCNTLVEQGRAEYIKKATGLVVDAYFSGTKFRWILENVDKAGKLASSGDLMFGTVDSWLVYNLTGGKSHCTDYTNASRTMLFNIRDLNWDDSLISMLELPKSALPRVCKSADQFGIAEEQILGAPVPICGIAGDQQAALFGQQCTRPGMAKNTYGTGCFMLMNTGTTARVSSHGLLTTVAWGIGDRVEYALEGSIFVAGAAVQWLRDGLGIIEDARETEDLARSVEDNGGVYFVPALTGLGAPHWDMKARGTLLGLTRGTTKAHIVRATLEAIAFRTREVLEAMQADAELELGELRVDGGASRNDFLMQFQADLLGTRVVRPSITESTALGAAYLAGIQCGIWSEADVFEHWQAERSFTPGMDNHLVKSMYLKWQKATSRARSWVED